MGLADFGCDLGVLWLGLADFGCDLGVLWLGLADFGCDLGVLGLGLGHFGRDFWVPVTCRVAVGMPFRVGPLKRLARFSFKELRDAVGAWRLVIGCVGH
ncbi:hypothetical protein J3E61_002409 [Mycobacterium sp. OAE908]